MRMEAGLARNTAVETDTRSLDDLMSFIQDDKSEQGKGKNKKKKPRKKRDSLNGGPGESGILNGKEGQHALYERLSNGECKPLSSIEQIIKHIFHFAHRVEIFPLSLTVETFEQKGINARHKRISIFKFCRPEHWTSLSSSEAAMSFTHCMLAARPSLRSVDPWPDTGIGCFAGIVCNCPCTNW